MPSCKPGNTGNPPLSDGSCFGNHGGIYSDAEMAACMIPSTNPSDDVGWSYPEVDNPMGGALTHGGVLAELPGCQTLSAGPASAQLVTC
ncbi:MAG: hypothetical protein LQ340_008081 [Diploschistes diacapsis]|nr:MAG: hypothetical protein LQ340_008081 [Diploschistes diacapsis]